ncbi:MAG: glycosyltransferase [Acidobacteria bacterium]|nr:glycosyltransferase [Acidobacteriota bacterium]
MAIRKLLLISYVFPPAGGVAVQRALSLAKYLPPNGFEVHVLKASNAAVPTSDPDLLKQIPPSVTVHGAFTPELPYHLRQRIWALIGRGAKPTAAPTPTHRGKSLPQRLIERILCPEPEVLWTPFALRKARSIIRDHGIEAVLVTVPPFSAFLVGNSLKREFPHLKLISDFRDEWLEFYLGDFGFQSGDYTRQRAEQIQRQTVEISDRIVAVTPSSLAKIQCRYPEQSRDKFVCITNGYDPDAFAGFTPRRHGRNRTLVTYVGTVYKPCSPRAYLDSLDAMPEEIRSRIETRFVGRVSDGERATLESRKSPVEVLGFRPHGEALKFIEETDYLLLTEASPITLPGKLFEYMATGKPILGLSPPGSECERVLRETGAGVCVDPANCAAVSAMIETAYQRAQAGDFSAPPDRELIRRYERPRLAADYGRLIAGLCSL